MWAFWYMLGPSVVEPKRWPHAGPVEGRMGGLIGGQCKVHLVAKPEAHLVVKYEAQVGLCVSSVIVSKKDGCGVHSRPKHNTVIVACMLRVQCMREACLGVAFMYAYQFRATVPQNWEYASARATRWTPVHIVHCHTIAALQLATNHKFT